MIASRFFIAAAAAAAVVGAIGFANAQTTDRTTTPAVPANQQLDNTRPATSGTGGSSTDGSLNNNNNNMRSQSSTFDPLQPRADRN